MLSSDGLRKSGSQIQFSLAALGVAGPQLPVASETKERTFGTRRAASVRSVNVSGSQILLGSVPAFGSMGLVVWAVVKLWLFGQ
jgi:hypothetical protein